MCQPEDSFALTSKSLQSLHSLLLVKVPEFQSRTSLIKQLVAAVTMKNKGLNVELFGRNRDVVLVQVGMLRYSGAVCLVLYKSGYKCIQLSTREVGKMGRDVSV